MPNDYRPRYHFTPPSGWMNDPNGLVYFEGEYHLFYQALWPRHWGHAVSTDLVHWEHLPIALAPDDLGDIWSGSAVVDRNNTSGFFPDGPGLVAIFTHQLSGRQYQSIAYSTDRGRTWTKYAGNPVIPDEGSPSDFRDPKVFWHAPTAQWVMIVAMFDCAGIYTSPDLKHWTMTGQFGKGYGMADAVWECPDLFPLCVDGDPGREKWVLLVSYFERQNGSRQVLECSTQYFVGNFDGRTFTSDNPPDTILMATGGTDDYAMVTWSDIPEADGRRIGIGWMNQWSYGEKIPPGDWQGVMTVPRELALRTIGGQVRLVQRPVKELEMLRGAPALDDRAIAMPPDTQIALGSMANAFEVVMEIEAGAAESGLRLRHGATAVTVVGYDGAAGAVFIDRTKTGGPQFADHFPLRRTASVPASERVTLHIFVDACSVEMFANDGAAYLACLIFPDADESTLELYAEDGAATVHSVVVYPLE